MPGLVDPFSPLSRRRRITGSIRLPEPRSVATKPPPRPPRPAKPRRQKLRRLLGLLLVPLIMVAISRLSQFLTVGELVIGVYGLAALVGRIPSRFTFLLACLSLINVAILLLILPDSPRAANTAVFAFLFLVVGTVSLALEARQAVTYSRFRPRR
jgi:hypothetical protein